MSETTGNATSLLRMISAHYIYREFDIDFEPCKKAFQPPNVDISALCLSSCPGADTTYHVNFGLSTRMTAVLCVKYMV